MIRAAVPSDLPALLTVQRTLREPSPDLLRAVLRRDAESASAAASIGSVLVSVDDTGRPVGYVLAIPGDPGWIAELAVAPGARREGRGTRLLARACDRLHGEGCTAVELAVAPDDEAALALYRSSGFVRRRRAPDLFRDGPALILGRDL